MYKIVLQGKRGHVLDVADAARCSTNSKTTRQHTYALFAFRRDGWQYLLTQAVTLLMIRIR